MRIHQLAVGCVMLLASGLMATEAVAQNSRVSYGRITAVNRVNLENEGARSAGAVFGGLAGLATGSGQSRSNRALRSMGGAAVGGRVAGAASSATGFEYTVLIGARTVRIVTEKSGLRVGDCVSVERGQFNNIRLAPDDRCDAARTTSVPAADAREADACAAATQQVLEANTDEEFDRAERRMRLLCG